MSSIRVKSPSSLFASDMCNFGALFNSLVRSTSIRSFSLLAYSFFVKRILFLSEIGFAQILFLRYPFEFSELFYL